MLTRFRLNEFSKFAASKPHSGRLSLFQTLDILLPLSRAHHQHKTSVKTAEKHQKQQKNSKNSRACAIHTEEWRLEVHTNRPRITRFLEGSARQTGVEVSAPGAAFDQCAEAVAAVTIATLAHDRLLVAGRLLLARGVHGAQAEVAGADVAEVGVCSCGLSISQLAESSYSLAQNVVFVVLGRGLVLRV